MLNAHSPASSTMAPPSPPALQSLPPSLQGLDSTIADALSAWLAALSVTQPNQPLHQAADHCVPLCQVFSQFAPQLLTSRDFFVPTSLATPNAIRQRRYNTRRLARSLQEWFTTADASIALSIPASASLAALCDAATADQLSPPAVLLTLTETLLCAAVHSPQKEQYIKAVLTLTSQQQEALAQSIRRTAAPDPAESPRVLAPRLNDENIPTANSSGSLRKARSRSRSPSDSSSPDLLSRSPPGIPLADYKALAAERDTLRRKLSNSESERGKACKEAEVLRSSLEEAGDRIRGLEKARDEKETEVANKAKALADVKNALREAHVAAEEVDVLRAKAAATEQLEASLKRASKRLEEVADMRRVNKELESQLSAFQESEQRMNKHTEYLEGQLSASTERAKQLALLSDELSSNLQEKEKEVDQLTAKNTDLMSKLDTANMQLASMLMQSTNTQNMNDSRTESNLSREASPEAEESHATAVITPVVDISSERSEFQESIVSDHLFNEIGVRMTWEDIVECIRGVMDALKEMELDESGHSDDTEFKDDLQSQIIGQDNFTDAASIAMAPDPLISTQSPHSEEGNNLEHVDHVDPVNVLPEFGELDKQLKAETTIKGDEFDFAANQINVREFPVVQKRTSQLMVIAEGQEQSVPQQMPPEEDLSSASDYTTDESYDGVDEVVDAVINGHPVEGATIRPTARVESTLAQNKNLSTSRPHSPFIQERTFTRQRTTSIVEKAIRLSKAHLEAVNRRQSSYTSLPSNMRRTTSLTVSVLGGIPRSPSHSETTRALVRQARSELSALQDAMEAMRAERQSSASIGVLVKQLNDVREELKEAQSFASKKESENNDLRRELNILMKEFDGLTVQKQVIEDREVGILKEKERLVQHLQESLDAKEKELSEQKEELVAARQRIKELQDSESTIAEKLSAAEVINRAQEVEIVQMKAKVEANDLVATHLNAVVSKTDNLKTQISREQETYLQDIAAAARREKELAEEAREEARRVAKSHASVLEDVRATAAAAAMARGRSTEERLRGIPSRKSTRFGDFWRRLLHFEKATIDFSMPSSRATMPPVPREPELVEEKEIQ